MKKLFGLLFGLLLLMLAAPAQAHAAEGYGVFINGEEFTPDHKVIVCGTGKATLNVPSSGNYFNLVLDKCLILSGPIINDSGRDLNIFVQGLNTIMLPNSSNAIVDYNHDLSLSGAGDDAYLAVTVGEQPGVWTEMFVYSDTMFMTGLTLRAITTKETNSVVFKKNINIDNVTVEVWADHVSDDSSATVSLWDASTYNYEILVADNIDGKNPVEWDKTTSLYDCKYLNVTCTPKPEAERYDIYVNGEEFTSEHKSVKCGSGTATLDVSATDCYVLTLDNCTIENGPISGYSHKKMDIKVKGRNEIILTDATLKKIDDGTAIRLLSSELSLTGIGDDASLSIDIGLNPAYYTDVIRYDKNKFTVRNLTLNISTSYPRYSRAFVYCPLEVDNSIIECSANQIMNANNPLTFATDISDYEVLVADNKEGKNPIKWDGKTSLEDYQYMKITPVDKGSNQGWNIDSDGVLHITGAISYPYDDKNLDRDSTPWSDRKSEIKKVVAEKGSSTDNCYKFLYGCSNLVYADLKELNTQSARYYEHMFASCPKLQEVIFRDADSISYFAVSEMFKGCTSLNKVTTGSVYPKLFADELFTISPRWTDRASGRSYLTAEAMKNGILKTTTLESAEICKYVTFNTNGHGDASFVRLATKGYMVSKPADPTAEGWEFGGWYSDLACTEVFDFNSAIIADITVYAKWNCKHAITTIRDAKTATCMEEGYTGDTYCGICMEKISSGKTINKLPHIESGWKFDADYHWTECTATGCGEIIKAKEKHADADNNGKCDACGYNVKVICKHEKTEVRDAREATCTKNGYTGDTYCKDCGALISSGQKTARLAHKESGMKSDEYGHWTECTNAGCGEYIQEKSAHKDADNNGKCDTCGYKMAVESTDSISIIPEETGFAENDVTDGVVDGSAEIQSLVDADIQSGETAEDGSTAETSVADDAKSESASGDSAEGDSSSEKSSSKWWLLIPAAVLIVGAGWAGAVIYVKKKTNK